MRVLFVTWGEVPRFSSVYGGQALGVVEALQNTPGVERVALLAGVPLIHSGMVREKLGYFNVLKDIKSRIGKDNFFWRNLIVPPVGVNPQPSQLGMFSKGHVAYGARLIEEYKPDVVHCRYILSAYMAHKWREASGHKFKIVFDARSYMPEESIVMGRWAEHSEGHKFWQGIEAELLSQSDLVCAVSEEMRVRFERIGTRRCELVYLNVSPTQLRTVDTSPVRGPNDPLKVVYCGALAEGTWHSPELHWKVFSDIERLHPGSTFKVITKSSWADLQESLQTTGYGHLSDKVTFTKAATPTQTVEMMQGAHVGLLSYRLPTTELEETLAQGVFATKTVEYLMAGVPVLVNRYCGGARHFVEDNRVGASYEPKDTLDKATLDKLLLALKEKDKMKRLAHENFSVTENAKKLLGFYKTS